MSLQVFQELKNTMIFKDIFVYNLLNSFYSSIEENECLLHISSLTASKFLDFPITSILFKMEALKKVSVPL